MTTVAEMAEYFAKLVEDGEGDLPVLTYNTCSGVTEDVSGPDGDNFKLWGFWHEQYHDNLVKEGCRYIEINQSLLASKLGVPWEDLDDVTYLYRKVDAGKLQEVVNDYKQRKYIFI